MFAHTIWNLVDPFTLMLKVSYLHYLKIPCTILKDVMQCVYSMYKYIVGHSGFHSPIYTSLTNMMQV